MYSKKKHINIRLKWKMHAVKLRTQHGNKLDSIVAKFVNILL